MLKITKIILILSLIACSIAAERSDKNKYETNSKYYFGGRIGTWINNGGSFPETQVIDDNYELRTFISDVNVYLDMFFGTRLFKNSYFEFSIGTVNRGSVTIIEFENNDIANLLVYNFMIQYKFYPKLFPKHRLQPYFAAGGGVHYARRSIQFTNNYLHSIGYGEESKADLNLIVSGGADWYLNDKLSLVFDMKYLPITFSSPLVTVEDYSAVTAAVGLVYRYK